MKDKSTVESFVYNENRMLEEIEISFLKLRIPAF